MSSYLLCAQSMYGKSHLAKELIAKLQNEYNGPTKIMLLVSFPDEWKASEKQNDDKHLYLKRGNQIEIYDKSKYDYYDLLARMVHNAFSQDQNKKFKIIFIDDATASLKGNDKLLMKLLTEARHNFAQLILAAHYLNSIHVQYRTQFKDVILFGTQIKEKLKKFWTDVCGQYYDRRLQVNDLGDVEQEEFSFDDFYNDYNTFMSGGLSPEDPRRDQFFHNAYQLSFPTNLDARALLIKILPDKQYEQVCTKNAVSKLLAKKQ